MAKSRTIVRTIAAKAPTIRVIAPRAVASVKHHGKRIARRVAHTAYEEKHRFVAIAASFGLGLLDKSGFDIPTPIPFLGKAGNGALLAYAGYKLLHNRTLSHVATGLACVAAYEMGKDGSISGDDVLGGAAAA
jgi:hypothetical protein